MYPILPPLTVSKAVVVFAQGVPSLESTTSTTGAGDSTRRGLDRLACLGCSGRLLLRQGKQTRHTEELTQLLGIHPDAIADQATPADQAAVYATLSKKYGGLKLGLLSNDAEIVGLTQRLHFPTVAQLSSAGAEDVLKQLNSVLEQVDLALVHIRNQPELHALDAADSLIDQLLNSQKRPFLVVVTSRSSAEESDGHKSNTKFYYPVQSATVIDGKAVELRESGALYASYYYEGATRRDEVQRYTEAEIRANGANGVIAAEQFIAELAFKLGKTPKYGA